jgi:pilus assembly protein FimV
VRLNKIKLHAERALEAQNPVTHRLTWRVGALAGAVALLCTLAGNPAHALGLGRITVQSALGEALRAEIDVPEISAEEASSLRVGVASADAFKAAGLEYTAAVVGVQVSLQKRPDGRSFLRLSSSRPVTEPFVDLILEASWASGRVVRDYTMLFDPPNLRQAAPAPIAPTAPALSRSPTAPPAAAAAATPYYPSSPPPAQAAVRPAPVAKAQAQPAAPKASPAAPAPASSGQKVAVKPGDTAGKIAAQNKPASISLDQMLVAMLRSNPDAFIGGNINRLKSGAVLDIPTAEEAGTLPASEASSTIIAQAKDFNDFRQKLASGVPTTQVDSATRKAGGKVQAKVEDRAAPAATPDKLTLSKGAIQGKAVAEDKIAKDKQAKDASARVAELTKNLGDLNKIAGATPAAASTVAPAAAAAVASAAKPPTVPGVQVATGSGVAVVTPASPASAAVVAPAANTSTVATAVSATSAAITPTVATPPLAVASVPVAPVAIAPVASAPVAVKKAVAAPPPPPPEPSLIDDLTNNPLVLPGLGALLALLAGFGFYRYKKRNDQVSVDSSFLESRLQPDSFFGASGGQRIDTSEGGNATGSSLVYSPSQLDAAGDVDPVAEADVYLAYGRDLQAEEILKEALRTSPTRVAIHAKLLEIYAKRRDMKGFEAVAADAFKLTHGNGPEWAYICELGRDLDPANPMYQPGGQPQASNAQQNMAASFAGAATVPQMLASPPEAAGEVDFDLDLDFSESDESLQAAAVAPMAVPDFSPPPAPAPYVPEPTVAMQAKEEPAFDGLEMDFGTEPTVAFNLPVSKELPPAPAAPEPLDNSLSFNLDPLPVPAASKAAPAAKPAPAVDNGMLEFDMGSLSLDLDAPITESPSIAKQAVAAVVHGPLETKLALAEEFNALGDSDGARSLANEVLAEADGALKSKAQAFLKSLS